MNFLFIMYLNTLIQNGINTSKFSFKGDGSLITCLFVGYSYLIYPRIFCVSTKVNSFLAGNKLWYPFICMK